MAQEPLVEGQIDDGRKLIERLSQNQFDVTAAFWAKDREDGQWLLYIASKVVDDKGLLAAYKHANETIRAMPDLRWIDDFELKLIGATHPMTKDALDILARYPAGLRTRYPGTISYRGSQLGNASIDQAYIYETAYAPGCSMEKVAYNVQKASWLARFLRCYRASIDFLERVKMETGYSYKDVASVELADFKDCPAWDDGTVKIGYNNDPESIAHELGHGLHEKIRETGRSDSLGEEFCEAVRFYVESEMKANSTWLQKFSRLSNPFTGRYTLGQFIDALKSGELFLAVGWK
ncbi:MAG TPA: hypothetical protein VF590_24495 [Isosphaeraceae bacterium]